MKKKVYIDGQEGTTGLQIYDRLALRDDITLLLIDPELRKDVGERTRLLNAADLVFLCLPDAAAREAVTLVTNPKTRIIDASTAHRTKPGWVYGFPELFKEQREKIRKGMRVANPGCHATGFLSSVAPLVAVGVIPADYPLTCYSLTGYSGGGKKMIADYEGENRPEWLKSPATYGVNLDHKHLPEMQKVAGLEQIPVFAPILSDIYKGMATSVMLHNRYLKGQPTAREICHILSAYYGGERVVYVTPFGENTPRLPAGQKAGSDSLELVVTGGDDRTLITALFDNLGKGASGAAVQNMNLMLGLPETAGLAL
ncbi:MAG: N-acetyl-gamma-glutamyl-phosphate reductase [Oscillospiraceae bacterium]